MLNPAIRHPQPHRAALSDQVGVIIRGHRPESSTRQTGAGLLASCRSPSTRRGTQVFGGAALMSARVELGSFAIARSPRLTTPTATPLSITGIRRTDRSRIDRKSVV